MAARIQGNNEKLPLPQIMTIRSSDTGDAMKTALFGLCSAAWMSLIFYLSSIPGDDLGPDILIVNLIKKAGHFIIFGVLAALYLSALKGRKSLAETGTATFMLSLFLTLLYAVSDEYHQSSTSGRHSSGYDVIIDFCGALSVLGLLYTWKIRRDPASGRPCETAKSAAQKTAERGRCLGTP
jgi:VanZ family protein